MSASFTPAPWWVDEDDRPGMEWNRHICAGYSNRICFMSNSGDDPSGGANARLVAAAPELLEALEGLIYGFPLPVSANEYELVQAGCDPTEARKIARAVSAIAKARGGGAVA